MPALSPLRLTRRGRLVLALLSMAVSGVAAWGFLAPSHWKTRLPIGTPAPSAGDAPEEAAGATTSPRPTPPPDAGEVEVRAVESGAAHVADRGATAVALVEALVQRAPIVVVGDPRTMTRARGVARRLHAPLLPASADGLASLLDRLEATTVVAVRQVERTGGGRRTVLDLDDQELVEVALYGHRLDTDPIRGLRPPDTPEGEEPGPQVLVPDGQLDDVLGVLTDLVGARAIPVRRGAVARDGRAVRALRADPEADWIVAGDRAAWRGSPDVVAWDVEVARSGVELPGGGLRMFPGRRLVALYGTPGASSLGVLGEQPVGPAVQRATTQAEAYQALVDEPVVPTFEIISTVATGAPGPTGDYSRRVPLEQIRPWVRAAADAGMYVILDLQPGRADFLTQAKRLTPLLRHPHVGLALDPEWRLAPDQLHLRQVGSVAVEEVQAVADWLAGLTRRNALPQKLFLLHQFRQSMLPGRAALQVPPELAVTIQMDGQGSQGAKLSTWQSVTTDDPPAGVTFGWKNFHDEDTVLRSPADTLAVEPTPMVVSYQ